MRQPGRLRTTILTLVSTQLLVAAAILGFGLLALMPNVAFCSIDWNLRAVLFNEVADEMRIEVFDPPFEPTIGLTTSWSMLVAGVILISGTAILALRAAGCPGLIRVTLLSGPIVLAILIGLGVSDWFSETGGSQFGASIVFEPKRWTGVTAPTGLMRNPVVEAHLPAVAVGTGLALWVAGLLGFSLRRRSDSGPRCKRCDYSLVGNESGRCPECGTARTGDQKDDSLATT